MKTIAFVGLGNMGFGMAKNLLKAGYPVQGSDISQPALERLKEAGGKACSSAAEAGEGADVAFVMVANAQQAETVIFGNNGLTETMKPGSTVIVTATIGIKAAQIIEQKLEEKGILFIDSAVSGGQTGANNGTLTIMASGKKASYEGVKPEFEVVGQSLYFVSEKIGMGQVTKSCMQALVATTFASMFEVMVLGTKAGADPESLLEVIGDSIVGSNLFRQNVRRIIDRDFTGAGANVGITYKDVGLTLDLARDCGVPMFTASAAKEILRCGLSKFPTEDNACCVKVLEDIAGVVVEKRN